MQRTSVQDMFLTELTSHRQHIAGFLRAVRIALTAMGYL